MSKTDDQQTGQKTIEVDEEVTQAVADQAAEKVKESLQVPTAEEIAEKVAAQAESTTKQNVHEDGKRHSKKKDFESMDKEMRFAKAVKASRVGDRETLAKYNEYVSKAWQDVSKADYQNVTTTSDGGALVPDPEFIAEVERLTDEYGTASRLADVRRTDRDSVTLLRGTNEVSFTETSEATAQNADKLTYGSDTVSLNKYIATLVMTSEIIEDSAIDIFADASQEVARARAKLFDELVFTDSSSGLLSASASDSYETQTVGAALSDLAFDDMLDALYKVKSTARRNGRFFMHPTVWNELRQTKTGDGSSSAANYYAGTPAAMSGPTPVIDGYPVELVDVMPDSGDITANEAFAVFGDLGRIKMHVKRLLETKVFDAGVVQDSGGSDINLITQDSWALRATLRAYPQTRFQGAFCIIGTGDVS